jgi:flagellin
MVLGIQGGLSPSVVGISNTHASLDASMVRISTGKRVRSAADDPAGMAVAVNLQVAAVSERQAMRNINDGMSMIQVAEGAAGETIDVLQRLRELAVQASSETLNDDGRTILESEFSELVSEVDRVASSADFNGQMLTDGSLTSVAVQVSGTSGQNSRITIELADLRTTTLGVDSSTVVSIADALSALGEVDAALDTTNLARANYGAVFRRLESAFRKAERQGVNLSSAASMLRDVDYAQETTKLATLGLQLAGSIEAASGGLRALESTAALVGNGGRRGGTAQARVSQPPLYEKGDFPEDLI